MPALPPYIPPRDANVDAWLANFTTVITANPAAFGLASGDATTIASEVATWHTAYLLVTSPTTKTATTVTAKNNAKITVLAQIRVYAQAIANNPGVTSANKIAAGLNPKTSVPVPITTPTTNPILTAVSSSTAGTILRYRDSVASPSVKAKPYGVIGVQIYAKSSATPITDPTQLLYFRTYSKSPLTLPLYPIGPTYTPAYFAARYVTRTGLVGPWSPIINYLAVG